MWLKKIRCGKDKNYLFEILTSLANPKVRKFAQIFSRVKNTEKNNRNEVPNNQ